MKRTLLFILSCLYLQSYAEPIITFVVNETTQPQTLHNSSLLSKFGTSLGQTMYMHRWITSFLMAGALIGALRDNYVTQEDIGIYFIVSWILCNSLIKNLAYNFEIDQELQPRRSLERKYLSIPLKRENAQEDLDSSSIIPVNSAQ